MKALALKAFTIYKKKYSLLKLCTYYCLSLECGWSVFVCVSQDEVDKLYSQVSDQAKAKLQVITCTTHLSPIFVVIVVECICEPYVFSMKWVKVGMHQGSGLSPLLFVIVMEAISREFRVALPSEWLYADDLAVIAETEEELIKRLNESKENVESKGMRVNVNKTKVMIRYEMLF